MTESDVSRLVRAYQPALMTTFVRLAACTLVLALAGCSTAPPPASAPRGAGTGGSAPAGATIDPGSLPSTGAKARVVNLYTENGKPVDVDVYAYVWSDAETNEVPV